MRLAVLVALAGVGACQCEEPLSDFECNFEVTPSGDGAVIEFNATAIGDTAERSWRVTNTGRGVVLDELAITFETINAEHYDAEIPEGTAIGPGDDETFLVVFHPLAEADLASRFVVSHPDVGNSRCPTATVFVRGTGFVEQVVDAGPEDAGVVDAGPQFDGGTPVDAGTVDPPDGGVSIGTDSRWYAYGAFEDARARFAAVPLDDGSDDIIAIGGYGEDGVAIDSIERIDATTGISRVVAHLAVPRAEPAAAKLPDGRILILGGRTATSGGFVVRTLEAFDPQTDTVTCLDPAGCGLDVQDAAILPIGRIGAVAAANAAGQVVVALGRTFDVLGDEVAAPGGEVLSFTPTLSSVAVSPAGPLSERTFDTRVVAADGTILVIGGRAPNGAVLGDLVRVTAGAGALTAGALATPRAQAAAALLTTGDVVVAGGFSGNGAGLTTAERLVGAMGGAVTVEAINLVLPARVGASLLALDDDILLYAGGTRRRSDNLDVNAGVVPERDADVLIPFGAGNLLRFSPDNALAVGRLHHQAFAVGASRAAAVFLGGVATSPRNTPHPQVERFSLADNRFIGAGLMGAGAGLEAGVVQGSGAALIAAGGVDPTTGGASAAVRAFDAITGTYVEAGELLDARRDHSLTRISVDEDNSMLVAGGRDENGVALASLSILDAVNQTDRLLPVALRTPRFGHTATRLADGNPLADGAVLICGGQGAGGEALDSCEVVVPPSNPLDPATFDEAAVVPVLGRMSARRFGHSATLLDTGEVLLAGGGDVSVDLVRADLFTPDDTEPYFVPTGLPNQARRGHAAVFLGSGRVLLVGGEVFDTVLGATRTAEVYVRASSAFLPVEDMESERAAPAAFLLADGNVLVTGGARNNPSVPGVPTRSNNTTELYLTGADGTGTFAELPDVPLSYARSDVRFVDVFGRAMLAGGSHRDGTALPGDERRSPLFFVDWLQAPGDAIVP
ncbi:MAG: hypothetical protein HYS27_16485 [Deltaproteobacteria bacterium]|nr:hypothetical protein [Deltaproteobacteria bacterium]